jgi:hypothetical protein
VEGLAADAAVTNSLDAVAGQPKHRSNAHPQLARDPAHTGPRGARGDDRGHLIRIAILQPLAADAIKTTRPIVQRPVYVSIMTCYRSFARAGTRRRQTAKDRPDGLDASYPLGGLHPAALASVAVQNHLLLGLSMFILPYQRSPGRW